MQVHHIHIKRREHRHRLFDRVRNVVELEVQEDFVTPCLDFADDGRTLGIEQLHADFQKGFALLVLKEVEEPEGVFRRLEVAGYDYIVLHNIQI